MWWSIIYIIITLIFGALIETFRKAYSILIFIIQISLISEFMTLIIFVLSLYYITFVTFYLDQNVCGFSAVIGGFIMCLTEIIPNSYLIPSINTYMIIT